MSTEQKIYNIIKELYQESKDMIPKDGFSSPRDIALVAEHNKKIAIMDHLQNAMRIINPNFEIREK